MKLSTLTQATLMFSASLTLALTISGCEVDPPAAKTAPPVVTSKAETKTDSRPDSIMPVVPSKVETPKTDAAKPDMTKPDMPKTAPSVKDELKPLPDLSAPKTDAVKPAPDLSAPKTDAAKPK